MVAFEQLDESPIPVFPIVHQATPTLEIEEHRYPFAGAENAFVICALPGAVWVFEDLIRELSIDGPTEPIHTVVHAALLAGFLPLGATSCAHVFPRACDAITQHVLSRR